jgi:hypothetical protein
MIRTGANGALKHQGIKVAKVRQWSLAISRAALDTSCIAGADSTFVPGIRSATGSASVLYDPDDEGVTSLLNSILSDSTAASAIEFVFDQTEGKQLLCSAFLTSVSPSVSVGDVQASEVSFQITGAIEGSF